MTALRFHDSIEIARPPEDVWDLVSDVTRTGEWSPICRACEWDGDGGPRVGARFTGHNRTPDREWSTGSTVVVADRGREFAWMIGDGLARWSYTMEPSGEGAPGGTRLTEWWDFRDEGQAMFRERYGDDADRQIEIRRAAAHDGIPRTLAAIKRILEGS